MTELTAEQRRALAGTDDTPGLLDQYQIVTTQTGAGRTIVGWLCPRSHADADSPGHLHITARDLDGDQTGLTLGELVQAALDHEAEEH